tara:strand:+ start:43 stop:729 length:687 start_codon:yes stop_codon:yes gene_type:complete
MQALNYVDRGKRPYIASKCSNLKDAEYWRRQIIREITEMIQDIQNAGLGEHKLRDMNDTINKKIRELGHWERRIKELGGPNYRRNRTNFGNGQTVRSGGYIYFGATRNLPGVRELFEKPKAKKKKRTRHEMYKSIDVDYYGYRDEDDGKLLISEKEAESAALRRTLETWKRRKENDGDEDSSSSSEDEAISALTSHVTNVPDQKDIEKILLERKKQALLEQFATTEGQ